MRADPPFVVIGLPRSRTAWLSRFLSYGNWHCGHEESRHWRSLDDVRAWVVQPKTGTAETGIAAHWRLLPRLAPNARVVIVRRPVAEVVESLMRIDTGEGAFDRAALTAAMSRIDAKLNQIEKRLPGVLSVKFADLETEETCATVFEHCLPFEHDHEWFERWRNVNVQCDFPALMRYAGAYRPQLLKLSDMAAHAIRVDMLARRATAPDGVTIAEEPFESWYRDGTALFEDHCFRVGEAPGAHAGKNLELMRHLNDLGALQILTARSNGRMFGYLLTIISPSLEARDLTTAIPTAFYASPEFPGLGMKLQRESLARLREMGVGEVFFRAGPRGSGPKLATMYRRLGAQDDGQIFRMKLEA